MTRRRHLLIAVGASLAALALACSGGSDEPADSAGQTLEPPPGSDAIAATGPGLSVAEARASTLAGPLLVNGFILVADDRVRLCSAIAESFPPQCAGDRLTLVGFDLDQFALTSASGVQWTASRRKCSGSSKRARCARRPGTIASGEGPVTP